MHPVAVGCLGLLPFLSAPSANNFWSALGRMMHMLACSVQPELCRVLWRAISFENNSSGETIFHDGGKEGHFMTQWWSFRLVPRRQTHLHSFCGVVEVLVWCCLTSQSWTQGQENAVELKLPRKVIFFSIGTSRLGYWYLVPI
jgi:hypothetical protein